jgi:hypothetical protein
LRISEYRLNRTFTLDRKKAIPVSFIAPLHLRVLGFGFLEDGDVGVGVFPEREEVLGRRSAP